ncbi:IS6 family transposase [Desulfosediminicola flagellatus]|uniref:IS6 family transposase n=1 Tax=Desulfosediminicola flagellatus TaxID=2569541 RepID=UPI0010ACFEC0|nr:IS6 family transposase [Desulfosediminicola flagellatus]
MASEERFHGGHFPKHIVLQAVFWYLRYSLSYRDIEELMEERGVEVDHATVQRWVVKYTPILEAEFRKRKKTVGTSWRMDETYIKVKGQWQYLYRAVDKEGNTIDFLLTKKRDKKAAKRFVIKAINHNGFPEKITIDGSAANKAAIEEFNSDNDTAIEIRQVKYLNNIVEQDHRSIKRITNSMLGFKSFHSASITLNGIELVHMLRKRQLQSQDNSVKKLADIFYSLAA